MKQTQGRCERGWQKVKSKSQGRFKNNTECISPPPIPHREQLAEGRKSTDSKCQYVNLCLIISQLLNYIKIEAIPREPGLNT